MPSDLKALWASVCRELERDHVSFFELTGRVLDDVGPEADFDDVRTRTLALLRYGLESGDAVAGQYVPRDRTDPDSAGKRLAFDRWEGTPAEIVAEADRQWRALGDRRPDIAEILHLHPVDESVWRERRARRRAQRLAPSPGEAP